MKKKRKHTCRLFLSAAAMITAFGILAFVWRNTNKEMNLPAETETAVCAESEATLTGLREESSLEYTKPATAKDPVLTAEAFAEQDFGYIRALPAGELAISGIIPKEQAGPLFYADVIDDAILARINGSSYTENDNIGLSELSYLRMLYYGFDQNTYVGEMIVNQEIASDILSIFKTLYENQYPIEKMVLVDDYEANDELSMDADNTSAFNYRTISGSSKLSNHSYGMAIDLNPKYNPYVKISADGSIVCQPKSGREYADRSKDFPHKIDENDLAYLLFTEAGFTWGGSWDSVKDYQHFEK